MNWDVFTKLSPLEIQVHWATATIAFFIGLIILIFKKGTAQHKFFGRFYAMLMMTTAIAAFFVRSGDVSGLEYLSFKGMSLIHLFVLLTLVSIPLGIYSIRVKKNIKKHRQHMIGTFLGGLLIAGAFTFLPQRRMHLFFFGPSEKVQEHVERKESQEQPAGQN